MKKITSHLIVPVIMILLFFAVAALPAELLGCRNRGLIAAAVALASAILGIIAAVYALKSKIRGETHSSRWMVNALIFVIPAAYIVIN
jgi:hypothetical protein